LLPAGSTDPVRVAVGLLLVVPAVGALLVGYAVPTVRTGILSLRDDRAPAGGGGFAGFGNYADVATQLTAEAYLRMLTGAALPLVALLVVGPMLAYAAHRAGPGGRWTARLVLAVPMVAFPPAAIAAAWAFDRGSGPPEARTALWLSSFGLAAGLGLTLFLAVLRGRGPGRPGWPAGVAVGAVAGIAAVAVVLQVFTYPYLLGAATGPMWLLFQLVFQFGAVGHGAAHGAILCSLLLVLGLGAAAVLILSQLRLTIEPPAAGPSGKPLVPVVAGVATGLGLLAVLAVAGYGLWPWLSRLGELGRESGPPLGTVLVNTWLPPLFSTVVGVGLAAAAGFGIGALRPLDRWSELLLLPFAPWLFVGVGPLVVAKFDAVVGGVSGDRSGTLLGLVPRVWLVVPALFLFTLLFRGLVERPGARTAAGYGRMLLAALPMLALVAGATWLVQSQSLLWGLVIGVGTDGRLTAPALVATGTGRFDLAAGGGLGLVLPVPAIVVFAVGLGLLQVLYLDRLAVRVGRPDPPAHEPQQVEG
jgi:hypothetical protein